LRLIDAAKYYKELDHQVAAYDWLQGKISSETMAEFAKIYSPAPTSEESTSTGSPSAGSPSTGNAFVDAQLASLGKYSAKSGAPKLDLGTTYFSQRDNYTMGHRTCNSSSCAMYLDWLRRATGKEGLKSDDEYLRTVLNFGDTIYHENQTKALAKFGFDTVWRTDGSVPKLNALVDAGFPVVVNILHRGSIDSPRGGHVIVICDRRKSEGSYISQDPYGTLASGYTDPNGRYAPISQRSFAARWQGGYRVLA
jgi:hypothetical protein